MLAKNEYSYSIRSSIYDEKFKVDDETTQAMAWISFPDLKPTYFAKYSIFSSASTIGKPLHLDLATINITDTAQKSTHIEKLQGIVSHQIIPEDAITNTIGETTLLKDTDTLIEDNEKDDGGGRWASGAGGLGSSGSWSIT